MPGYRSSGLGGGGGSASHDWLSIISRLDLDCSGRQTSDSQHALVSLLNQTLDLFQVCFLNKWVWVQQGPGSGAGPHPVQVSLDTVVQDLGGQLGLGQLRPQEGGLHTHTLHTLLPAQVPAQRWMGSIMDINTHSLWFHNRSHSGSIKTTE